FTYDLALLRLCSVHYPSFSCARFRPCGSKTSVDRVMAFFSRAIQHVLVAFVSALLLYPLYILFLISFSPVEFTLGSLRPLQWPGGFTIQNLVPAIQSTNLVDPTMQSLMMSSLAE